MAERAFDNSPNKPLRTSQLVNAPVHTTGLSGEDLGEQKTTIFRRTLALEFGRYPQSFSHLGLAQELTED
jgi:hypothetical protein